MFYYSITFDVLKQNSFFAKQLHLFNRLKPSLNYFLHTTHKLPGMCLLSPLICCMSLQCWMEKERENQENIRYQCGCIFPTPDPSRSADRLVADGESIRSRQDIRMDISFFCVPQAGPSTTCLHYRKTQRKDKDESRADRLQEPRSPLLFTSCVGFWFDPERMIVMGGFFGIWKRDGWGWCRSLFTRW